MCLLHNGSTCLASLRSDLSLAMRDAGLRSNLSLNLLRPVCLLWR